MASARIGLPTLPRCDRPSARLLSSSGLQPGNLAQGPDDNCGLAGRIWGLARRTTAPAVSASVMYTLLAESTRRVGTAWPVDGCKRHCRVDKAVRATTSESLWKTHVALHNRLILLPISPLRI